MRKIIYLFALLVVTANGLIGQPTKSKNNSFGNDIDDYARLVHLPAMAIGIAKGDSLIFFKTIGVANPKTSAPITKDHIFPIASLTKSFTAVALKQLEGEGKLSLNDPIDKFPNQYFTKERWDSKTTLAHIISQTAESDPLGTCFIYNGGRYNIAFNAFASINTSIDKDDITKPFTDEIQKRILSPLNMDHTLLKYSDSINGNLKPWLMTMYKLNDSTGQFTPVIENLNKMQAGPGFGMRSSMADLVKYANALGKNKLISQSQYQKITSPFYPGSPYGMGWFTTNFEGNEMHWAYGYGDIDAALILRVPSKDLTLIMLSACSLPSASTRFGYGNPLNSILVCSFVRNYLWQLSKVQSRIFIEEQFAEALTLNFLPKPFKAGKNKTISILKSLMKKYPTDTIWQTPSAFELISEIDDKKIQQFGLKMADQYLQSGELHPAKSWFGAVIYQKAGNTNKEIECLEKLTRGDAFREQPYKWDAMMELARIDSTKAKDLLERLIRYKDYVGSNDKQYKEAKEKLKLLAEK